MSWYWVLWVEGSFSRLVFLLSGAGTESHSVGVDVFCFSQRPTSKAINEKAKVGSV